MLFINDSSRRLQRNKSWTFMKMFKINSAWSCWKYILTVCRNNVNYNLWIFSTCSNCITSCPAAYFITTGSLLIVNVLIHSQPDSSNLWCRWRHCNEHPLWKNTAVTKQVCVKFQNGQKHHENTEKCHQWHWCAIISG